MANAIHTVYVIIISSLNIQLYNKFNFFLIFFLFLLLYFSYLKSSNSYNEISLNKIYIIDRHAEGDGVCRIFVELPYVIFLISVIFCTFKLSTVCHQMAFPYVSLLFFFHICIFVIGLCKLQIFEHIEMDRHQDSFNFFPSFSLFHSFFIQKAKKK